MATAPLMDMATGQQDEPEETQLSAEEQEARILEQARPILNRLESDVQERIRRKGPVELRWIEELRAFHGRYDPKLEKEWQDAGRSTAYVKMTRSKTTAWAARLTDLLFPTDDENWDVQPTPVPALAKAAKEAAALAKASAAKATEEAQQDPRKAALTAQMGQAFADYANDKMAEMAEAKKRCEAMKEVISDQLVETNYAAAARDVIEDGCKLGTGIMKGPLTSNRLRKRWVPAEFGYRLEELPDPMPEYRRVDPWHFFPDPNATCIAESESEFERHLPTKKDLRKLAMKMGFSKPAVRRLLNEGPSLALVNVDHLAIMREIVDGGQEAISGRYIMWEFHGALEADEVVTLLKAAGRHEDALRFSMEADPLIDHRVILFFCQNEILKIEPDYPLDSCETLYSVWNFEKGESSIWGVGVPHIMNHSQKSLNGAWRMMMDNGALSVGPQIVVNKDQITPQDTTWGMRANKIWLRTTTANVGVAPFEIFNIPSNQAQLGGIIELAKNFIDEEIGLPMIAQGEQGTATGTLGGMSMLFNSANVVFRRVVKAFDDELTKPTIRRAYDWNMQFHPDENIKGDMKVDARGSSVLLVREIQSANLLNVATNWTVHPVIGAYVKVRPTLKKTLQTMMIEADDVLFSQEEADERQAKAQAAQAELAQQGNPADQARIQVAEIDASSRQAVANANLQATLAKIASDEGISMADAQAKYGIKQLEIQSKERMKAAEIGVEERRAREAKAEGQTASSATGQGVG